jgi:hypothetical protein
MSFMDYCHVHTMEFSGRPSSLLTSGCKIPHHRQHWLRHYSGWMADQAVFTTFATAGFGLVTMFIFFLLVTAAYSRSKCLCEPAAAQED